MRTLLFLGLAALALICGLPVARAQESEQDRVYQALQAGRIRPLPEIRGIVVRQFNGQLIGNELDEGRARQGNFIYRFTLLQPGGAVMRVEVDALSGRVLRVEGQ